MMHSRLSIILSNHSTCGMSGTLRLMSSAIQLKYKSIPHEFRMECKAKALEYVCSLLDARFQCVIPVENAACTLAVTKDGISFLPIDVKAARLLNSGKFLISTSNTDDLHLSIT